MNRKDMHSYVDSAGELVVQPRMGMTQPADMAYGLTEVAAARAGTVGTVTLDSYTRVGDNAGARAALDNGSALNGFPIVAHGPDVAREVAAAAGDQIPVQVRHGSPDPTAIFETMVEAGLSVSEGGPVSYCLPYSRTPLAEAVDAWRTASRTLADGSRAAGRRAHLETFGGCMLGQLCPPSLLVAISVLEGLFFAQQGVESVSLSYAQQTNPVQDVEALAAMRELASSVIPAGIDRHIVLYTYMGVFPRTEAGAQRLLDRSAQIAVRGGAERLIVKTTAEAHRIPTVAENVEALENAAAVSRTAADSCDLPWAADADYSEILAEASALVDAVLAMSPDVGQGLLQAFASGVLDVPYCLHADNHGNTQGYIDDDGRLRWAKTGNMPLPGVSRDNGSVDSDELLRMLRYTSERHDQLVEDTGFVQNDEADEPHRVAVVGSGPRGVAVVERMAARLAAEPGDRPVEIVLIDSHEVGCGRVWRTDQSDCFLMNTVAGEVTMFSGPADDDIPRAGAGPTLAQWWAQVDPDCPGPDGYAPRPTYGRYLNYVLDAIEAALPGRVSLRRVHGRVDSMSAGADGGRRLRLSDEQELVADRVLLATGHPLPELAGAQRVLADFAATHDVAYLPGDSVADMALDQIRPGDAVGVLGLGLSFYDVMAALTEGRGGSYSTDADGRLRYRPSGREPQIIAGSRSGVPLPARGRNQKPIEYSYKPSLFTHARIRRIRHAEGRPRFVEHVLPWLLAEVDLVYYATAVRTRRDTATESAFIADATTAAEPAADPRAALRQVAQRYGVADLPELDIERMARPFAGRTFDSRADFDAALLELVAGDLAEAELGNVNGPLKAALDVFRDTRGVIRTAVDFGALDPESYQEEFLGWFCPIASFLSAGPPRVRLEQVVALIEAGVLRLIGPGARFGTDPDAGRFTVGSEHVTGAHELLDAIVDARIPSPDVRRDPAPLSRSLVGDGTWTSYVSSGPTGSRFDTGGVAVTAEGLHPVSATGTAAEDVCVLGIPTEHTRWFTQVGSGRPGKWGEFVDDADAVAALLVPADITASRAEAAGTLVPAGGATVLPFRGR